MKRIITFILAALICMTTFAMTSCSGKNPENDWENIQKEGKFVVGCTLFEPMNYNDENGNFVGFDTEYAKAVADYLGVEVEFEVITWSKKYVELESGTVDCLWNGFTSNSSDDGVARSEKVDFAVGYANNYQCVVVNTDRVSINDFGNAAALAGKTCAVEGGSAGEAYAKFVTDESKIVVKDAQTDAFTELKAGTVDFIVVDVLLANRKCGTGDFAAIQKAFEVEDNKELYGIGFRKGSSFTAKVNEATKALINDGENGELSTLEKLSEKYGVPLSPEVLALKESK